MQSPRLKEGARAEVIVLLEDVSSPASQLSAFNRLETSLNLDEKRAREWSNQVRDERRSFGP